MPYKDPEARKAYDRKRHKNRERTPISRGKATHVALLYLRSRRGPVQPSEFAMLNPKMFARDLGRTLGKLVDNELAVRNSDGSYTITKRGVNILYQMATPVM